MLLDEVLAALAPSAAFRPRTYVDGTLGAGGHASAMLGLHGPRALRLLVGVDVDATALALAGPRLVAAAAAEARRAEPQQQQQPDVGGSPSAGPISPTAIRLLRGNHADVERLLAGVPWPEAELGPHPALAAADRSSSTTTTTTTTTKNAATLLGGVDAMLLDLGVSSMQIDDPGRGFSFMRDGPLDMRMGRAEDGDANGAGAGAGADAASSQPTLTAADIVNTWSEAALAELIRDYGEEKMWRRVAARIVRAREEKGPLLTTSQLTAAIGRTALRSSSGASRSGGGSRSSEIHPATRTFQALRIAVNDELGGLGRAIPAAIAALAPGGRLAVISFHSLEDRVVKHAMLRAAGKPTPDDELAMAQALGGASSSSATAADRDAWRLGREAAAVGRVLTRRPVLPGEAEVARNPRARSAKLRVFEKFGGGGGGGGGADGEEEAAARDGGGGKKATHRSKKWRRLEEEEGEEGGAA